MNNINLIIATKMNKNHSKAIKIINKINIKENKINKAKISKSKNFIYNWSDMVEDGFWNNIKNHPELIVATLVLLALSIRWMTFYT